MKLNHKYAVLPLAISFALTGCIEVDDDSNREVAAALQAQNELLQQQNDLLNEQIDNDNQEASVTVRALVIDANSEMPVTSAMAKVLRGDDVLAEVEIVDGVLEIESLPPSSDLVIEVYSIDNSLMTRAFFLSTMSLEEGTAYRDIGLLEVSEPVDIAFSVTDSLTGEPISGLSFSGSSFSGYSISEYYDYIHTSSFNDDTGMYEITLPRHLNVELTASIDFDSDGIGDLVIDSSSFYSYTSGSLLHIRSANRLEADATLVLSERPEVEEPELPEKSISLLLLDGNGDPLEDAIFNFEDGDEVVNFEYDAENGTHNLVVPFDGGIRIEMASFVQDEVTYSSGVVSIYSRTNSRTGETSLEVSASGFSSNSYFELPDVEEFTIVLEARDVPPSSDLEFVTDFLKTDFSYEVYYSEPVMLDEAEVALTYNTYTVTPGNASNTDAIPSGTTQIDRVEVSVDVSVTSELGDIKFTVSPDEELLANTQYNYEIGSVSALSDGIEVDLNSDELTFTTPEDETVVFDINDVIVDNENFYSNGGIIVSENTAGEPNTAFERDDTALFIFPASIESLEYLTIRMFEYFEDGATRTFSRTIEVVSDGNVRTSSRIALKSALNENISREYYINYIRGTVLETGKLVYPFSTSVYIGDNTATDVNTISFTYEYLTKDGEPGVGTLTLPVQ
ncbi:hypothetical protein [Alteromonas sp. KUL49]|uniref:hypothetical protein n=1 Tax=Alteromonas sp. KUL49 TaxID=2480798 RepID=UPI00102EE01C|nr:hypothetical protein [Alteromonas sp. KUL49]TAP39836.1 hypothetical protein EYS00_11055 [Alteromonas sp. KUL49]GEA11846.1 hypothetical protein KUL49_22210 [Alteromonas sp. KUL49]